MKILADEKGREAIQMLCDIALKSGGLQSMQGIQLILNSLKLLPKEEEE